jgi:uncharacterized RDD family membrane protein YckC
MPDDAVNPYAPPSSAVDTPAETMQPAATNGKRFLNYIIDQLSIVGVSAGIGVLAGWMHEQGIAEGPSDWFQEMNRIEELIYGNLLTMMFYTLCESVSGRTPGKLVTGTRAVMKDRSPLTTARAMVRSLCRLIPFEPLSFFLRRGGWHDTITSTMVIDLRARPIPVRKTVPLRDRPLPPGASAIPPPRAANVARSPVFRPGLSGTRGAVPRPSAPPRPEATDSGPNE